jgi:hypothetical protein
MFIQYPGRRIVARGLSFWFLVVTKSFIFWISKFSTFKVFFPGTLVFKNHGSKFNSLLEDSSMIGYFEKCDKKKLHDENQWKFPLKDETRHFSILFSFLLVCSIGLNFLPNCHWDSWKMVHEFSIQGSRDCSVCFIQWKKL